ncbi:MAG: UDP-N-acetylmuramoyl-tripeptide--D-alanyl-D-alanine ligase [Alphaproteobacteria bacterium]|nr:UDP-N-acetylmuramoyl-tripeptide--D-alanyl-D-alanine ligase [Alphaproteobacteria bacterium]
MAIVLLSACGFCYRRLLRYLHMFQQDDYNEVRLLQWLWHTGSFDRRISIALVLIALLAVWVLSPSYAALAVALLFAVAAWREPDPRVAGKKKLVITQRARRILVMACLLQFLLILAVGIKMQPVAWVLAVQFVPLAVVIGNILLRPVEARIQAKIMREAVQRLQQVAPKIIGITGSFGKTSVKHILGHVLEVNASTLYTPGSVNTLMGISRIIREKLPDQCRFFIVEMGAYGVGSITRLCRFTPPDLGIITAIGEAHYERFKSLDGVAHAKFELADSVWRKPDGQMVLHQQTLSQPYAAGQVAAHRGQAWVCGAGPDADAAVQDVQTTPQGLTLSLTWCGMTYALQVPLFGKHHADNVALAFVAAATLGIAPEKIVYALRTVPQIKHRLEVKKQGDMTLIDDAFNSNPRGFAEAVDVMALLASAGQGRAILVTPGLVELGERHDQVHHDLGVHAAQKSDVVLAIAPDRIPDFITAIQQTAPGKTLLLMPTMAAALAWVRDNARASDVVLLENDLPDLYEARLSL